MTPSGRAPVWVLMRVASLLTGSVWGQQRGKGDKMTYQSRFGVQQETRSYLKRPYRLLYLPPRKASCRETKDVPYLKIQGHTAEGLYRRRLSRALGAQRRLYAGQRLKFDWSEAGRSHLPVPVHSGIVSSPAKSPRVWFTLTGVPLSSIRTPPKFKFSF